MGKALVSALIVSLFAGFTDDVCALCLPAIQADGTAEVADGLAANSQAPQAASTGAAGKPAAPVGRQVATSTPANRAPLDSSALRLRGIDPIYCFMSIQR